MPEMNFMSHNCNVAFIIAFIKIIAMEVLWNPDNNKIKMLTASAVTIIPLLERI